MFDMFSNIDWSVVINAIMAVLVVFAGSFVVLYRKTLAQIIVLLNAVADVTDGKTSKEELAALRQAWQDLVNLLKNYKGLNIKS